MKHTLHTLALYHSSNNNDDNDEDDDNDDDNDDDDETVIRPMIEYFSFQCLGLFVVVFLKCVLYVPILNHPITSL